MVGVGLDQAGIDREALATDQAGLDAGPHDAFEDAAKRSLWRKRSLRARRKAE
jgi:hypothetical protein